MKHLMFRFTFTTYYRGFRVFKTWDEPEIYPERSITAILGWVSFRVVVKDTDYNQHLEK